MWCPGKGVCDRLGREEMLAPFLAQLQPCGRRQPLRAFNEPFLLIPVLSGYVRGGPPTQILTSALVAYGARARFLLPF